MKRLFLAATAVASVFALAGCSGAGSSDDNASAGDSGGLTTVTVGGLLISCDAPIYLGEKLGYFTDEGLKLDMQPVTGGAAAVPSVESGSWQFAASNVVSIMVARDKGLNMKLVTPDCASNGSTTKDATAVVVLPDSPITSARDLAGKTVSINTLANIGDTTVKYAVEKDGGDPSAVKFVQVAFPDAEAALQNKQVDAAWIAEPFLTKALQDGCRIVSNPYVAISPTLSIDGYFATDDTVKNKPELVKKFKAAMKKSLTYAQSHPDEVRQIVSTYTKIDPDLLSKIALNKFYPTFDRKGLQELGDAAARYGLLSKKPNLDELIG